MTGPTRSDRHVAVWLGACFALLYLPFNHGHLSGSDEVGVFLSTRSLYQDGDLAIGPGKHNFEGRDGRRYSIFAVGQSVLALPFYAAGDLAERALPPEWVRRGIGRRNEGVIDTVESLPIFTMGLYAPLASGVLIALFFLFQRRLGSSQRSSLLAAALLGASTYVASQSIYLRRHTTEAISVLGALYTLCGWRQSGRLGALATGVLLASATLLIRVPSSVTGPALAAYLLFTLRERARLDPPPRWGRVAAAILVPGVAVLAVHLGVNQWKWGTWIASPMLDQSRGFVTPLHVGVAGLLFSPGSSLFVYSPLLLLLPWTVPDFWRRHRAECATALVAATSLLLLSSGFELWHGMWSAPGPRMIFTAVPLLMLPLGAWLDRERSAPARAAVWGLASLGVAVQLPLLLARWRSVVEIMGYKGWDPAWGFLWEPFAGPALGAYRTVAQGEVDVWLVALLRGVPGREPAPELALAVLTLWSMTLALCMHRLWRALRS